MMKLLFLTLTPAIMLSEISQPESLTVYGPLGIITCWLMYRDEKRAKQLQEFEGRNFQQQTDLMHRIDGLTRALLVRELETNQSPAVQKYAKDALAKIEARAERDSAMAEARKR